MAAEMKMADLVLIPRHIQGDTLYMCEQFGVDGNLYVEEIRTWCFITQYQNEPDDHANQV